MSASLGVRFDERTAAIGQHLLRARWQSRDRPDRHVFDAADASQKNATMLGSRSSPTAGSVGRGRAYPERSEL
jgi:hypothetical protein